MWVILLVPLISPLVVLPMIKCMLWGVVQVVSIARQRIELWVVVACEVVPLAPIALIWSVILTLCALHVTHATPLGHTVTLHCIALLILILAVLL
jgi:hypothetical protein